MEIIRMYSFPFHRRLLPGAGRSFASCAGNRLLSLAPLWLCALVCAALTACDGTHHRPPQVASNLPAGRSETLHPIQIAPAPSAPRIFVETPDGAAPVACGTCHRTRESNGDVHSSSELDEFHQGLTYAHGEQTCISCHEPGGYDRLRLADGTSIEFSEVHTLCRQCHGTQARDYEAGVHGGWTGHWDLKSGPRMRNQCVHCHDPHAPAFPMMQPSFRSIDRFLDESNHSQEE